MFGLLQLLPQSDAFRTLQARLHAAPTAALLALAPAVQPPGARSRGAAPLPQTLCTPGH